MNIIVIAIIVLLVALFLKVPIFVSILAGSAVYFIMSADVLPTVIFVQRMSSGVESITLLAVPFFVAVGVFMNYSGVTQRVMNFCGVIAGRMHGGLAQVNVLLSTLMGGLSGSSLADAAMQSKILVPEMEKQGISKAFSSVVTATSAMITPLIPPGIAMILYGSIANVSIGKLFVAGVGPGVLLCVAMMLMISVISRKKGYAPMRTGKLSRKELTKSLGEAFLPLLLPIVIIGGIRFSIFTPTEAGTIAIVYALILGLVYREMKGKDLISGIKEIVTTTASIMLIVGSASAFAWILTRERIPQMLTETIISTVSDKYVFLLAVNLFLIIVGMFVEGNAAMIVLVPLLAPIAAAYGIDEIHFAMIFIFNMSIGGLTPPMGTLMFVTCGVTKCKIKDFIKEAVHFYILLLVCLLLLTYVPEVSTFLVNLIY